ncbi:MAG: amino acid ABC transporter permease [Chloroflexota bacterium]
MLLLLTACSGGGRGYSWGWYTVSPLTAVGQRNLAFLAVGFQATILVSLFALAISIVIGLVIALLGLTKNSVATAINRVYVEVFRSIPVLVLLLWVYYGLPISLGIELGVFSAGVLALALCDSAFEAEVFRSGIQSVPTGQSEAAKSLGMTPGQTMRFIVLPQAIRTILPTLGNQFVYMLKVSSLVSVIGLNELTRRANELTVIQYRPLEIYTILVLEYLVLILVASFLVRRLEKRMGTGKIAA